MVGRAPGSWLASVDYGPGYRVYYLRRGEVVVVLLCGGDKRTQHEDIRRAHAIALMRIPAHAGP